MSQTITWNGKRNKSRKDALVRQHSPSTNKNPKINHKNRIKLNNRKKIKKSKKSMKNQSGGRTAFSFFFFHWLFNLPEDRKSSTFKAITLPSTLFSN